MPEVAEPESAAAAKKVSSMLEINIVEQIEYYFGDFNMMKDKFLKQEVLKNDGWVPLSTLLRFNRLAALSKDADVILSSFKNNPSSIVEVNEDTKSIRRNPERPVPEQGDNWRSTVAERTVYVKGFPKETTTIDDILNFMNTFGKVDNVIKRSYFDKALKQWKFKGSTYVSFPTKEGAESFMSIGSVKFNGNELIRKWQNDYIEEKKNERIQLKLEAKESKNQLLKDQQTELIKDQKLPKGALLLLSGLNKNIGWNELKTAVTKLGWDVGFVDYTAGESTAYVRLQKENSAKDALSKLTDNSFEVKDVTVKAELVEGEKETELLVKMQSEKRSRVLELLSRNKGKKGKGKNKKNWKQTRNNEEEFKKGKKEKLDTKSEPAENKVEVKEEKMETEGGDSESKKESNSNADLGSSGDSVLKRKGDDENQESVTKKSKSDDNN